MKRSLKWIAITGISSVVILIVLLFLVFAGPKSPVLEGTQRPDWLPEGAVDVYYRSRDGFGWWKAAEFSIGEKEFRAYAAAQGWTLSEERNFEPSGILGLLRPEGVSLSERDRKPIDRALIYERRAGNNGGIIVAYDLATHRAYYSSNHR